MKTRNSSSYEERTLAKQAFSFAGHNKIQVGGDGGGAIEIRMEERKSRNDLESQQEEADTTNSRVCWRNPSNLQGV